MPFLSLDLKCTLNGVTDLQPQEPRSFRWYMKLKCTNCGEAPEHWQYVTIEEILEVPGSRGEANLVEKCKLCNRVNTLTILPDSVGKYVIDKNEEWQSMVVFDCRGIEPTEFDPRVGWQAVGVESSQPFDEVDLSEKMWADYDEKAGEAVEISNIEIQFSHSKQKK